MRRSKQNREADALVRLYKPTWTDRDDAGSASRHASATWWLDYREDGKRRRENTGTPYEADANLVRARLIERLRRKAAGLYDPFREAPLRQHLRAFLVTLRSEGVSRSHLWRRRRYLARILGTRRGGLGARTLADLDADRASAWLDARRREGLSARSQNHYVAGLKQLGRWLAGSGRAPRNPFAILKLRDVDVDRRVVRRALTPEEVAGLLAVAPARPLAEAEARAAAEAEYRRIHGRSSKRGAADALTEKQRARLLAEGEARVLAYRLLLGTGLRRGELRALQWAHVDLKGGNLHLPAWLTKARDAQGVPLAEPVLALLAATRATRRGEPASATVIPAGTMPSVEALRADLRAAGIEPEDAEGRRVDVHALRGSFVSALVASGADPNTARVLARHADVRTTQKHYVDPRMLNLRGAVDAAAKQLRLTTACLDTPPSGVSEGTRGHEAAAGKGTPDIASTAHGSPLTPDSERGRDSGSGGTRTLNLGLKRPLLYRLSYAPPGDLRTFES
jgi:integrase